MPLRILHISTRLILGGSQENTVLSCEGQARRGHRVHLAFGPIYGPEGSLLSRVEQFNFRCKTGEERTVDGRPVCPIVTHTVPHLIREVNPIADLRAKSELRELIRRIAPDVVHTHSSKAGILGRVAAWQTVGDDPLVTNLTRRRIVHTIHGPPFMPVEGTPLRRLKTRLTNYLYTLAERHAARRCHAIISVADAMTQLFLSKRIGTPPQYTTVYSGMETQSFLSAAPGETRDRTRAALGLRPDDFVVGTVARLAEHKGHDDLLDALAPDLKANPHWKLLWVGDGWWRERLTAKAESLGLSIGPAAPSSPRHNIVLTGLVPTEEVPPLIRAMDVLAHPSYREGLPRTVPQALLCGVCPVAYDADGAREICRELETGRLVPLANLARLREAITWCADNPLAARALAMRGQSECAQIFSTERMTEELLKVYQAPF
ncbi:MAG: glycosyltransferase [Planctomycetes bacterium]|nr:glycosyltransferase [Planctomycetota bacterium]